MYKILIVDDEIEIRNMLSDFLSLLGYLPITAKSGEEALEKVSAKPDLILLDVNMPDMDGFTVCKKMRSFVMAPIVFLTAKVEEQDKVAGLMVGGDDYIVKPFSMDELSARIQAHLRREERKQDQSKVRFFQDVTIDMTERKLFVKGKEIILTKTEFNILEILSMHKGQIFDKEAIYEKLWGYDKEGDSNIITEHIRRIRSKVAKVLDQEVIETVWGVGYRWIG